MKARQFHLLAVTAAVLLGPRIAHAEAITMTSPTSGQVFVAGVSDVVHGTGAWSNGALFVYYEVTISEFKDPDGTESSIGTEFEGQVTGPANNHGTWHGDWNTVGVARGN